MFLDEFTKQADTLNVTGTEGHYTNFSTDSTVILTGLKEVASY